MPTALWHGTAAPRGPTGRRAFQLVRGMLTTRPQTKLLLALGDVTLPVPLRRKVFVDRVRQDVDLLGDKCQQSRGRSFRGGQSLQTIRLHKEPDTIQIQRNCGSRADCATCGIAVTRADLPASILLLLCARG